MVNSNHLKRHSMPVAWPIKRKNIQFISKPNAGSHKLKYSSSVLILLRNVLGYVKTSKEAKYIINEKLVLVNGKIVNDIKFAVGMFDTIEFKKVNEKFIVLFDEFGKLKLIKSKDNLVYLKLFSKTILKGKKVQLNFMNGYNILVNDKIAKSVSLEDTVVYDFVKKKIDSILKLKENSIVYIFNGTFKGSFGLVKKFISYNGLTRDVIELDINGKVHTTAKDYCFVIGTKKEDLKRFV